MPARRWKRTRSAAAKKATQRAARAAAQPYLTGEKVRRHESPKMIAQHGRAPWPPKKAAAEAYNNAMLYARVEDKYALGSKATHYGRKGKGTKKTSRGGTWSLRDANVTRDKTTGRFKKRAR